MISRLWIVRSIVDKNVVVNIDQNNNLGIQVITVLLKKCVLLIRVVTGNSRIDHVDIESK